MIGTLDLTSGTTLAEGQGMTEEIGRALARVAGAELAAGRLELARGMLEGLVVTNPYDPAPWALLASALRRRGKVLAARVCAETAWRLSPEDEQVRLVRAEVLLCTPDERPRAAAELAQLGARDGEVAARARALLAALGHPGTDPAAERRGM